ncbi:unnamed protein product [Chrysoparadoxa australica]
MELLMKGNRSRTQQATKANAVSSRSHAVLQVLVENRQRAPGTIAQMRIGKLSLVDLAGSERASITQNRGMRLVEGANINRSLLALGNCINALGEKGNKGQFVPYRDSKLTRLLKDSLGGNCRTVMIANIAMTVSSFEETLNTLKYANRAKNIRTNVKRNVLDVNYHISEYVGLIDNLRNEINHLKHQLDKRGEEVPLPPSVSSSRTPPASSGMAAGTEVLPQPGPPKTPLDKEFVSEVRECIVENFRERMQMRRSLIELEDQNVQNSIEAGKRQVIMVEWKERAGMRESIPEGADEEGDKLLWDAPAEIRAAFAECGQLRSAIAKNNDMKRKISRRLWGYERKAERFREELASKVAGADRKELMELQYRIGKLELDNMELEQSRIVYDSVMKGKDLTIQKLQLQVAVRDKVLQHQRSVLQANGLDDVVGYSSLEFMEQDVLADNFDTMLRSSALPGPLADPPAEAPVAEPDPQAAEPEKRPAVARGGGKEELAALKNNGHTCSKSPTRAPHAGGGPALTAVGIVTEKEAAVVPAASVQDRTSKRETQGKHGSYQPKPGDRPNRNVTAKSYWPSPNRQQRGKEREKEKEKEKEKKGWVAVEDDDDLSVASMNSRYNNKRPSRHSQSPKREKITRQHSFNRHRLRREKGRSNAMTSDRDKDKDRPSQLWQRDQAPLPYLQKHPLGTAQVHPPVKVRNSNPLDAGDLMEQSFGDEVPPPVQGARPRPHMQQNLSCLKAKMHTRQLSLGEPSQERPTGAKCQRGLSSCEVGPNGLALAHPFGSLPGLGQPPEVVSWS